MKRLGKAASQDETDIDITPMLDVVFIMLIFFIVTASFLKESGIDVNKPPTSNEPPKGEDPPKPIIVEVTRLDEIRIANRAVDFRSIKPTITRLKAESPESAVIVKLHPKAKTKMVVKALDGVRSANVLLPTISMMSG